MEPSKRLLGKWKRDQVDLASRDYYGETSLEFKADGTLIYTEYVAGKQELSILTYRIEGASIVTDQPSQPRVEKTEFGFTDDGKLTLTYDDVKSVYVRD